MTASIDEIDRRILQIVQERGRLSAQELAEAVGQAAPATCWRRLKSLEEAGVISGYQAIVDGGRLGYKVCAFVHLSIERQYKNILEEIEQKIRTRPEVMECYMTTGDSDFMLRVIAKSIDDYEQFIQRFLFELPGVSHVRSNIALREIKQTGKIPI